MTNRIMAIRGATLGALGDLPDVQADILWLIAENERLQTELEEVGFLRILIKDMREAILLDPAALTYGTKRLDVLRRANNVLRENKQ